MVEPTTIAMLVGGSAAVLIVGVMLYLVTTGHRYTGTGSRDQEGISDLNDRVLPPEEAEQAQWSWICAGTPTQACGSHGTATHRSTIERVQRLIDKHKGNYGEDHRPVPVRQPYLFREVYGREPEPGEIQAVGFDNPQDGDDEEEEVEVEQAVELSSEVSNRLSKPWSCPVDGCDFETDWKPSVSRHLQAKHPGQRAEIPATVSEGFTCQHCPRSFETKAGLRSHTRHKHPKHYSKPTT